MAELSILAVRYDQLRRFKTTDGWIPPSDVMCQQYSWAMDGFPVSPVVLICRDDCLPGSSPSRIQGYPQDDGLGDKDSKAERSEACSSVINTES